MRVSLLQPSIVRGNVSNNVKKIQKLIDECKGSLAILPEYAFTGSLVLEKDIDIIMWTELHEQAEKRLIIPKGKSVLVSRIEKRSSKFYNVAKLLPIGFEQVKINPDETEVEKGISSGNDFNILEICGLRFRVMICTDIRQRARCLTNGVDALIFIFHFNERAYNEVIPTLVEFSKERKVPVLVSSIVSDLNIGFSSFIDGNRIISLGNCEGILEITL